MSYLAPTRDELHKMILDTATKLVANDLVNDSAVARYQYTKTGIEGTFLDMEQAASDAGELVVECFLEACNREVEIDGLDSEEAAALAAAEQAEESQDRAVAMAEREAEIQYANQGAKTTSCVSPKSSSKISASTRPSMPS